MWFIAYIFISYIIVVPFVLLFWICKNYFKNTVMRVFFVTLSCLMLIGPLLPYIRISALTLMYGDPFNIILSNELQKEKSQPENLRVINITNKSARVYIINKRIEPSPQCNTGETYDFIFENSKWKLTDNWDVVWSECGSAGGNIFPPYPTP